MFEPPDTITDLASAIDRRFFAPLRRPRTRLIAVKDGEFVRTSPPHGNEYIYNPEDYRLVYMNFARL